jgi:DNA-binding protein Fis
MFLSLCPPEKETKNLFIELNSNYKHDLETFKLMMDIVKIRLSDDIIRINKDFLSQFSNMKCITEDSRNLHSGLFRKYLIQHNLGIFQKYFSQVKMERISQMIDINLEEVEQELADMCIQKHIFAKINRINFTVNFKPRQDNADKLNEMNFDLGKMLDIVEDTCHLIHKENLKYDIK